MRPALLGAACVVVLGLFGCTKGGEAPSATVAAALPAEAFEKPISFAGSSLPPYVASVRGFAQPETFGRWINTKIASIEFSAPLPREFDLEISAAAFGPNIGEEALVVVGVNGYPLRIRGDLSSFQAYSVRVDNPTMSPTISFVVPRPVTPEMLGLGKDSRYLGIALGAVRIKPVEAKDEAKK